jgi:hypothetical protein
VDEDRKSPGGDGAGDTLSAPADAGAQRRAEIPPRLRRRLEASAAAWNRGDIAPAVAVVHLANEPGAVAASTKRNARSGRMGWFAAGACMVLAIAGWWPRLHVQWQQHGGLLLAGHDASAERWVWDHEPGIADVVRGEVVWDNIRQHGHLTLELRADQVSSNTKIQLWVYDAARDERYPVAAGVLDVPAHTTRLTAPIKPTLHIARPAAFAVTLEPTGGVVVPDHSHVVAVARTGAR